MDKKDISATDPLKLVYPANVNILFHKFSHTSRANLSFNSILNEKLREIVIEINGDEALERGDGGVLNLLYSGPEKIQLSISGRIKGVPNGFSKINWGDVVAGKKDKVTIIMLSLMAASQALMGCFLIFRGTKRIREVGLKGFGIVFFGIGMFMIIFSAYTVYDSFSPFFFGLQWAP